MSMVIFFGQDRAFVHGEVYGRDRAAQVDGGSMKHLLDVGPDAVQSFQVMVWGEVDWEMDTGASMLAP